MLAPSRIVRDAYRASDVVARIRGLARRGAGRGVPTDVNAVVRDMLAVTR